MFLITTLVACELFYEPNGQGIWHPACSFEFDDLAYDHDVSLVRTSDGDLAGVVELYDELDWSALDTEEVGPPIKVECEEMAIRANFFDGSDCGDDAHVRWTGSRMVDGLLELVAVVVEDGDGCDMGFDDVAYWHVPVGTEYRVCATVTD